MQSRRPSFPADFLGQTLEEIDVVGAFRRLAHPPVDLFGVLADQDAPAVGLDAVEDDLGGLGGRGRRVLEEAPRPLVGELADVVVATASRRRCPSTAIRARIWAISLALRSSESLPLWTLRELVTIEVPMWPGMTTEHLTCGALMRRSVISASVKPFTANLAAL